jgi:hypothetical protein
MDAAVAGFASRLAHSCAIGWIGMDVAVAGFHASVCSGAHAASGKIDILMADEHHEPDRPLFALTAPHALRSPHPLTQARAHPVLKARSGQLARELPTGRTEPNFALALVCVALQTRRIRHEYSRGTHRLLTGLCFTLPFHTTLRLALVCCGVVLLVCTSHWRIRARTERMPAALCRGAARRWASRRFCGLHVWVGHTNWARSPNSESDDGRQLVEIAPAVAARHVRLSTAQGPLALQEVLLFTLAPDRARAAGSL